MAKKRANETVSEYRVDAIPAGIGCQQCGRLYDELRQALRRVAELEAAVAAVSRKDEQ